MFTYPTIESAQGRKSVDGRLRRLPNRRQVSDERIARDASPHQAIVRITCSWPVVVWVSALPYVLHTSKCCRMASAMACVRFLAFSFVCALVAWVRTVSSPNSRYFAISLEGMPKEASRKTASSRGVK